MMVDQEMLKDFVNEVKDIRAQMSQSVSRLIDSKMQANDEFEAFGQMVDRIYGTAATLGFDIIADYTKALKETGYMASASENEKGRTKALKMFIQYIDFSDKICESIFDKSKMDTLDFLMRQEISKAELLNRKEFYSVQKKSC